MNGDGQSGEPGARVERTGIALVHEGEHIAPAPGSEAMVAPWAGGPDTQAVAYNFPVEVEVVGELSDAQRDALAAHVFDELASALDSRA